MRVALAFLTRLPVPTPQDARLNPTWFPLVGLVVGALAAGVRAAADQALPPTAATVLALAAAIVLTGGLHEDGLADVSDALGAHVTRERRLEILKDPRVGTFGALALGLALLLAVTTLAALDTADAVKALVAGHVLSRWAILPVSRALKPAKPGGAGSLLSTTTPDLLAATLLAAAAALLIAGPAEGAAALAAAALAAAITATLLQRGIGGVTGDGYGAAAKAAELAVYTTLAALFL